MCSLPERVSFLLRPGDGVLRRDAGGGAQPIIDGVRRLELTYFDGAGIPTTDPAQVTAVRIRLEAGSGARVVRMETHVSVRNHRAR